MITQLTNAKVAQQLWKNKTYQERSELFTSLKRVLNDNIEELAKVVHDETGKLRPDFEAEIYDVIDAVDYYLDLHISPNSQAFPNTKIDIKYEPFGIIALIMPWNFPFYSPVMFIITSLLTGNAVMYKPSEYSIRVGLLTKELFVKAGFPENLIQIVIGDETVGRKLVTSEVNKIFFVGSVNAAKDISSRAGSTPVQIEAGGNSAAIVLNDADIDLAVDGIAWGGTYYSGQDCVGVKRVYIESGIYEEFKKKLIEKVKSLRAGIDYGPYIRKESLLEVKNRIESAVKTGEKLLCGGEEIAPSESLKNGYWLSPSVVEFTSENIKLVKEETFGNVLPIKMVENAKEAITLNNDSKYGLSTSIFSKDIEKAKELARSVESGMVFINDPFIAFPGWDHWTGWNASGFGTTESKLMQCLRKKVITTNSDKNSRGFWYPYPS
jgi:acyl-CoA reductase-like NAD-dependent aldehyde dehydrogenase